MTSRIPPLPSIGDLIRLYGLSAKQKLSQNFLLDLNITDRMVKVAGNLSNSTVIEVGPGPGSLTRSILKLGAKKVIVVEKDSRFLPALEALQQAVPKGTMNIVHADMLTLDEARLLRQFRHDDSSPIKLLGNLPFNVGTPLLIKWLKQIEKKEGAFAFGNPVTMVLLLQLEVAQRIVAKENTSEYGRLSVMSQRVCATRAAFNIPGKAFVPPPKVDTTVIRLDSLDKPLGPPELSTESLEYILKYVFSQRRKMISNSMKAFCPNAEEIFEGQNVVSPTSRPQELTVEQWCFLAHRWQQMRDQQDSNSETAANMIDVD